jgi:hypothetical protein
LKSKTEEVAKLIARAASHEKPIIDDLSYLTKEELSQLSDSQRQLQISILEQQLQENRDNHNLRTRYANKIFWLVCGWLGCVIIAVLFAGFELFGFRLSDKVLMTFIATTTLNVLGLFAIVAKWMFQQNPNNSKRKNK